MHRAPPGAPDWGERTSSLLAVSDRDPPPLPPQARAVLSSPDLVARMIAAVERDPQRRWMLRRSRALRRDYIAVVIDSGIDAERWMLLQDDETRDSYVEEVLVNEPEPDRQAIWLLVQTREVRMSYIAGVLDD